MRIGYGRVSTTDQNLDAQRTALEVAGCEEIYLDQISGKLTNRPELDKVMTRLRAGDTLVITKLDRLGRSLKHLLEVSAELEARTVDLVVLDQGLDTSTPVGRFMFQILGAVAEFERSLNVERTMDGLASARAKGKVGGRKSALTPAQVRHARFMRDERDEDGRPRHTVQEIADELGVGRATIYRALDPDRVG
ncbi:recombinase family protein [Streptomyces hydrogenans]|uniref:DNA-invertase n=1 Tax=Streptomyces hydrogenans TaxID=1873719 RepID=A0ABQ3PP31_9ACTN|nr:recombinase family protein [Streptomyces hydrogenans]GHG04567.1 DNA-invertase [Streptomyces hydrogenans]GHI26767.1 DNA-invertase [Streptomyces hydrogenans]